MSSEFGNKVRISVFGESHGNGIGAVVSGLPAGEEIDMQALSEFMERRRGGKGKTTTARAEKDAPIFVSGVTNGKTNGFPLCLMIQNEDKRSVDYEALRAFPRPGHADYTAFVKWNGMADMRGGGHFSGRLTAPLCAAGGIAKQILEKRGVFLGAHAKEIAGVKDESFPLHPDPALFREISAKKVPVIHDEAGEKMIDRIESARNALDSVGGIVEAAIIGLPAGLASPMFDGLENRLAQALFGIPAVKGVEFGSGFESARMTGSENNDEFYLENDTVKTRTNHAGGSLGGITTGMPVVVRAAFKPTPSIEKAQGSVDLIHRSEEKIAISGRHDPCVVIRAVPVVEAVCALCALDLYLEGK